MSPVTLCSWPTSSKESSCILELKLVKESILLMSLDKFLCKKATVKKKKKQNVIQNKKIKCNTRNI